MGPAPVGGCSGGGKVSIHQEAPLQSETAGGGGEKLRSYGREHRNRRVEAKGERFPHR